MSAAPAPHGPVIPSPQASLAADAGGGSLLFRQLFDAETGTFTHLLADVPRRQGVRIDAVFERHDRDLSLIRERGIDLVAHRRGGLSRWAAEGYPLVGTPLA